MFDVDFYADTKAIERKLTNLAYKQMPFAISQSLTAIARHVQKAERLNEEKVLDRPTPFTQGAVRVIPSRKDTLEAQVVMQDATARYLEPYQFGGTNVLNSKALLKPIGSRADLNQYGNLPRNLSKQLLGRSDIFIGSVKTKAGQVNGVWQRITPHGGHAIAQRGSKMVRTKKNLNSGPTLKLLIRFTDAHPVKQYLNWFGVAQDTAKKHFNRELGSALAKAIATARN